MKNKIAIAVIFAALATLFVRHELAYPSAWDRIHKGMSRQEVYGLIGPGEGEFPGWKGPSWRAPGLIVWHELHLSMSGDRVTSVGILRYWGEHHEFGVVRSEPVDSP